MALRRPIIGSAIRLVIGFHRMSTDSGYLVMHVDAVDDHGVGVDPVPGSGVPGSRTLSMSLASVLLE